MRIFFLLFLSTFVYFPSTAYSYELVIVKNISKEGQTFVTRTGKKNGIVSGKKSTFTSEDVSIIATAVSVSREFTLWRLDNNYTEVPFRKNEVITMYDTQEYLWTLNPKAAKRKLIKSKIYAPSQGVSFDLNISRGLTESTSEALPENNQRGGYQFGMHFLQELNINWALLFGFQYSKDIISLAETSITNERFIGIFETRYYFDQMEFFYDTSIYIGIGIGYGQSRTELVDASNVGTALVLPNTKLGIQIPISTDFTMAFESSIESIRLDEKDVDNDEQSTNLVHGKVGFVLTKKL